MYDVILIGGGLVGASTAYILAKRNLRILLIEQFEPAHDRGSSHGDGRMIRYDYGEALYVEMVARAYEAWDALGARVGEPVLQRTGICNFGPTDSPELSDVERSMRAFGLPTERLTAAQSNARFPQYRIDAGSDAVYQKDGGVLFADQAVLALWRCAREEGVETVTGARVKEITVQANSVTVQDETGREWHGERLVLASGAWSASWLEQLGLSLPLEVTQEQVVYFPTRGAINHRVGVMPNCIDYHTSQPFYCLPQVRVPGVKVGWHHTGPVVDPDNRLAMSDENLKAVQDFVRRRCPYLDPNPLKRVDCLYTNTPDFHFIMDRHPQHAHIVVATGFSGHGFKFGPVLGELLTALLFDEKPFIDTAAFSITRFDSPNTLQRRATA